MDDESIYKKLTKGVRRSKTAIFLCGASGSGKSTTRDSILNKIKFKHTHVLLNLDDIIVYKERVSESRKTLINLFRRAVEDGYPVLYDGTCRYPPFIEKIIDEILKDKGYKVVLVLNYASLDKVIERVKQRFHQQTPIETVKEIYEELSQKAEEYMSMKNIDELYLFSNETQSKMVFSRKDKKIKCVSPDSDFYFDVSKYC